MASVSIVVQLELDGKPLPGSPFTQILDVDDYQSINVRKSVDAIGTFTTIPTVDAIDNIQALLLTNPDAEMQYRLNGQTDSSITVEAGGLILFSNCSGSSILASNSSSGMPATLIGFVAGSI